MTDRLGGAGNEMSSVCAGLLRTHEEEATAQQHTGKGYSEHVTEEKETGFRFFSNSAICSSHTTCHVADRAPALGEVAS